MRERPGHATGAITGGTWSSNGANAAGLLRSGWRGRYRLLTYTLSRPQPGCIVVDQLTVQVDPCRC
ncbi:MAG: hypothetical protein IPJ87_00110 [Flavobacteriales bacterium]|nr:hypothetical protein [Flavobacteriales bacterium]